MGHTPDGLYCFGHCEEVMGAEGQVRMWQPCGGLTSPGCARVLLGKRFYNDGWGFVVIGDTCLLALFGGLHSALLRLLATNYPHLCIVDDWICEEHITGTDALLRRMLLTNTAKNHSPKQLQEGMAPHTGPLSDWHLDAFFCTHICVHQTSNERGCQGREDLPFPNMYPLLAPPTLECES